MQRKVWGMAAGCYVCAGICAAGLLLQALAGPVYWDMMAWPANIATLLLVLLAIVLMHCLRRKVRLFRWMQTLQAGVPAMAACAMLTILLGVTRQVPPGHTPADPFGITAMLSFWPFVLSYLWLTVLVGMVCMPRLSHPSWRDIPFLLNHLGIFTALVCGTLGSADTRSLRMMVQEGQTEWRAVDGGHRVHELPVAIELHDFIIAQKPLRYLSDVTVYTKKGVVLRDTVSVNHPLSVQGWTIYQYSYSQQEEAQGDISVFELVRDPWHPFVRIGILMMLAGAVSLFIKKKK